MTRQDIERDYTVNASGVITTPGRFEGEMLYVPYFWEFYVNGVADRDDGTTLGFDVSADERQMFPELNGRRTVKLWQRSDGFVCEV